MLNDCAAFAFLANLKARLQAAASCLAGTVEATIQAHMLILKWDKQHSWMCVRVRPVHCIVQVCSGILRARTLLSLCTALMLEWMPVQ